MFIRILLCCLFVIFTVSCNDTQVVERESSNSTKPAAKEYPRTLEGFILKFSDGNWRGNDAIQGQDVCGINGEFPQYTDVLYDIQGHQITRPEGEDLKYYTCFSYKNKLPLVLITDTSWHCNGIGIDGDALLSQFDILFDKHNGEVTSSPLIAETVKGSTIEWEFDKYLGEESKLFKLESVQVEKVEYTTEDQDLTLICMTLDPDVLEETFARVNPYPQFTQFGKENKPASLDTLISLLATDGPEGVLNNYDFSSFELDIYYSPFYFADDGELVQHTSYILNKEDIPECIMSIENDSESLFSFSENWFADVNTTTTESISDEFDSLFNKSQGFSFNSDSPYDIYDVEFSCIRKSGIHVVKRHYESHPSGKPTSYYAISKSDEPPWFDPELVAHVVKEPFEETEPNAPQSVFKDLIELTGCNHAYNIADEIGLIEEEELLTHPGAGFSFFHRAIWHRLDNEADISNTTEPYCTLQSYDGLLTADLCFNHEWLMEYSGLSSNEIDAQFSELADMFASEISKLDSDTKHEFVQLDNSYISKQTGVHHVDSSPQITYHISPAFWNFDDFTSAETADDEL